MLFKSVRSSSGVGCLLKRSAFLGAGLLISSSAGAALTVSPVQPDGSTLINSISSGGSVTAYFPISAANLDITNPNVLSVPLNLASKQDTSVDTAATTDPGNPNNAMFFNLSSDSTTFSGYTQGTNRLVLMATASVGGQQRPVPISWISSPATNGVLQRCTTTYCDLQDPSTTYSNYFYGAPFAPGQTVRVGIYPSDICTIQFQGLTSTVCSPSNVSAIFQPASTINITFYVVVPPNGTTYEQLGCGPTVFSQSSGGCSNNYTFDDSSAMVMSFQSTGGTMSTACPDQDILYTPGDQRIFLDTTQFQFITTNDPEGTGYAAAEILILASSTEVSTSSVTPGGSYGSPPDTTIPYFGGSGPFARVPLGETQKEVDGFTNSDENTSTVYNLAFLTRDYAGYISTGAACPLNAVRTSQVLSFLNQSKCFIATAAYRSPTAAPVMMLRQFRDEVLLQFGLGKSFVRWYYHWSPPAAEWLMAHSEFRYPVLVALVPLEIVAWLCLRPLVLLSLLTLVLGGAVALRVRRQSRREGEAI